jgi:hypothetical protein
MVLSDNELLDFDASGLAMAEAGRFSGPPLSAREPNDQADGGYRARTGDLYAASVALSQLS